MHALSSATRSTQPTATQGDPSDTRLRASSTARSGADRTSHPQPHPKIRHDRRQTPPEDDGGRHPRSVPRPRRGPKADRRKMNRGPHTESDRRRPRSPPTSHGSARGRRRRRPSPPTTPQPRRSAPLFRAHPPAHGHRTTPQPDPTTRHDRRQTPSEGEAGRQLRSVARPRRGPKADKTEDEPRPPHRIRPPPSQAAGDLPRQRARAPEAPTSYSSTPGRGVGDPALRVSRQSDGLCVTPRVVAHRPA